ncbi:MAG TPA: glycosyltransferase [Pyrinomonadaceae bacterium]|nr:glycosyltransferase [Pyrinomonadaceae bacterium]
MRILQIISARYFGGGERHVVDLARGLRERGHHVFVATRTNAFIRPQLSFLPDGHILEFPFRGPLDGLTARSLANLITGEKIDLIHAHAARDYTVAAMAAYLSRTPFVITRHVLFPMSKLHRVLLRGVEFVIAPSQGVADSLRERSIFPAEKIVTIRHGLNTGVPATRKRNSPDQFVVGAIGALDPVKGFDVLIRAAAIVVKKVRNARFEISGIDRGSIGHNEQDLRKLIADLDLEDVVKLTGWSPDIHETLAGLDLFVSSSRSESFGYVLAEAMLAGVPVVATETGGAREVIGDAGPLVAIESPEALANRIITLLESEEERESLSARGRNRILENFTMDVMIDKTEEVYWWAVGRG